MRIIFSHSVHSLYQQIWIRPPYPPAVLLCLYTPTHKDDHTYVVGLSLTWLERKKITHMHGISLPHIEITTSRDTSSPFYSHGEYLVVCTLNSELFFVHVSKMNAYYYQYHQPVCLAILKMRHTFASCKDSMSLYKRTSLMRNACLCDVCDVSMPLRSFKNVFVSSTK